MEDFWDALRIPFLCLSARSSEGPRPQRDVKLVKDLINKGTFVHPNANIYSFTDLAQAMALCCGLGPEKPVRTTQTGAIVEQVGGLAKRHIVFILCDGMGQAALDYHLKEKTESFLRQHNRARSMSAIFPSTTPAALTTLATAAWPGQHGVPGWDLRDKKVSPYISAP